MLSILAVFMLFLSGCTDSIPEMTEEQQKQVTEYAAQLLLKYDARYESSVLTEEEMKEIEEELIWRAELEAQIREQEQQAMQEQENAENGNSSDNAGTDVATPANADIDEFLGLDGIQIEYVDYIVCDCYPMEAGAWQGVTRASSDSASLVVFRFTVQNTSGVDYLLDTTSLDAKFVFKINGSIIKSSLLTCLENDLIRYQGLVPAGETVEVVLVIELSANDANNLQSIRLIMKMNDNRGEKDLL